MTIERRHNLRRACQEKFASRTRVAYSGSGGVLLVKREGGGGEMERKKKKKKASCGGGTIG